MSSSFSLEDRNKFVGRMDRMFTENLQMRKDMNKIIMRSQNIVRAVKLEKKVCAPQIPTPRTRDQIKPILWSSSESGGRKRMKLTVLVPVSVLLALIY